MAFAAMWTGGGWWSQEAQAAVQLLQEALTPLEAHLGPRTFVAGHALSLADLVLAADLRPAFQQAIPRPAPLWQCCNELVPRLGDSRLS